MLNITEISNKVKDIINVSLPERINDELNLFFSKSLPSFVSDLKLLPYKKEGTYFNRIERVTNTAKTLCYLTKDTNFTIISDLITIRQIGYTTFLSEISPEIKDYLAFQYAKNNNFNYDIVQILENCYVNKTGKIAYLSALLDNLVLNAFYGERYTDRIPDIIKLIVELETNISLTALLQKITALLKKQKHTTQIKNEIKENFKKEFIKLYGKTDLLDSKVLSISVIFKKMQAINQHLNEFKRIKDFYKKVEELKPYVKKQKFLEKRKEISNFKHYIKTIKKVLKTTDYEIMIEDTCSFIDELELKNLNAKQIKLLLKVKSKFQKIFL
ncbi:MAG: hypothetical protein Ta2D_02270 [Rickettsiales bacterium]|nr:MAG: hypothetical protein Ta2D_02270 [Rickettsiales bacterium]